MKCSGVTEGINRRNQSSRNDDAGKSGRVWLKKHWPVAEWQKVCCYSGEDWLQVLNDTQATGSAAATSDEEHKCRTAGVAAYRRESRNRMCLSCVELCTAGEFGCLLFHQYSIA